MRILVLAVLALSLTSCAAARSNLPSAAKAPPPPGEAGAAAVLESTPRHGEYADVARPGGGAPIRTWVSYPERAEKAGVVIVIQEIYGLTPWLRSVADALAAAGFVGVVPDLISGLGPGGGGTESVPSRDSVVALTRSLSVAEAQARLADVRAWAQQLPASNGKFASVGFCWGGSRSFELAAATPPPQAAVVFYGSSPDSATLFRVRAPVLGHYGGDDARVNATIEPAQRVLRDLDRSYTPVIHPGAGHGFLRQQDGREGANFRASVAAWPSTIAFLREHLE